jgi:quercetin dioxygenase-like cupin family protein
MAKTRRWKIVTLSAILTAVCAALVSATTGSSFTTTQFVRSTSTVRINIKTHPHELNDVLVQKVVGQPDGYSGWHSHPGYGIVAVKAGVAALYDGDDQACNPKYVGAGEVFVEEPGHAHLVKSVGNVAYEAYATFILPPGVPPRNDVTPGPANCPCTLDNSCAPPAP